MRNHLFKILVMVFVCSMANNSFADHAVFFKNNVDGSQTLTGHVPGEVGRSKIHHHADAKEALDLQLVLPVANQAQLDSVLKGIYDPSSPIYHHFLTSDQFNQQFKASDADLNKIKNYFASKGFAISGQSPNGTVLHVQGSAGAVEHVFKLHINHYTKNDGTLFRAPDADPTISTEIAGKIAAVAGLDNIANRFKPHLHQLPVRLATAHVATPNLGTGPGGYLAPGDVKTAYNLNTIPTSTNNLQNVALFELDGYLTSDIATYESYFKLPNNNSVMLQNVLIDGYNGKPSSSGGSDEVTLDIEELIGIAAASLNKIYVYEASNSYSGWMDEWTKMANDNTAKIISCSWGIAEYESPFITFDNQVFQKMAAQGQEVFVASGDCGAYADCSTKTLSADEPSSQPYVTGVGISAVSINSNGTYKSETASTYGGGGISGYFAIPSYQVAMASAATTASKVSKTMRNAPDVALTSDPSTAYSFYITDPSYGAGWYGFWGSSIAAPTWAAFMAQVNQGRLNAGQAIVGFLNPVIYPMAANSTTYANDFHDITTGNNQYYPAAVGFDDAIGLGSFNGANMYTDLVGALGPATPTGLTATAGNAQVVLSWTASSGAVSYNVGRATVSGGPFTTISTSGAVTTTSYTNTSLTNGTTYYYVVSAVNAAGQSANSSQVSATPLAAPAVPANLNAVAGNAQVVLTWNTSLTAVSYNVKRATVSGGPYTAISTAVTATTYTDTAVTNATSYYYVVSAVNASGESVNSAQVKATPAAPVVPPPAAPTSLSATAGNASVTLTWGSSSGATSYNVKRSTVSGGSYTVVSTSGAVTTTRYSDTAVANGTTYYYVVSAVNAGGEGANSAQTSALPVAPPTVPTGLGAIAGNAQVVLSWAASTSAVSYNVKRSTVSGGSYTTISTSGAIKTTSYVDAPLTNGTTYYYVVSAVNASGESANSAQAQAQPVLPVVPPAVPTGLSAMPGNNQVSLTWGTSSGAVSYNVKRATVSMGSFTVLAVGVKTTSYVDTTAKNGTTYYYVVSAVNAGGVESANSNQFATVPFSSAQPPTGVVATAGMATVSLSWNKVSGALWYYIERSTVSGGPYNIVGYPMTNSFKDISVRSGVKYYYVITTYINVYGVGSISSNSEQVTAKPS